MKQKLAWLALPLVLFALVWSVKWRAYHPMPTKQDLKFQKFLSRCSMINITHYRNRLGNYTTQVSPQDFKPFAKQFYLLSSPAQSAFANVGTKGLLVIHCAPVKAGKSGVGVTIKINLDDYRGRVSGLNMQWTPEPNLHPVTVKRWMELLLSHPRIGPELRERMKS